MDHKNSPQGFGKLEKGGGSDLGVSHTLIFYLIPKLPFSPFSSKLATNLTYLC